MAPAEWLQRRPVLVAAVAGAVLGAVIGLFLPIRAADPPRADELRWSLPGPQALQRFRDDQYQAVRAARYWNDVAAPGRGRQAPSTWTPVAILTRPEQRLAVTVNGKPGTQWIRIGQPLPDGATLVALDRDRLWFEKDGCRQSRPLYPGKPDAAPTEACAGSAAGATPAPAAPAMPAPAAAAPPPGAPRNTP